MYILGLYSTEIVPEVGRDIRVTQSNHSTVCNSKTEGPLSCLWVGEWVHTLSHSHTVEYYAGVKKDKETYTETEYHERVSSAVK